MGRSKQRNPTHLQQQQQQEEEEETDHNHHTDHNHNPQESTSSVSSSQKKKRRRRIIHDDQQEDDDDVHSSSSPSCMEYTTEVSLRRVVHNFASDIISKYVDNANGNMTIGSSSKNGVGVHVIELMEEDLENVLYTIFCADDPDDNDNADVDVTNKHNSATEGEAYDDDTNSIRYHAHERVNAVLRAVRSEHQLLKVCLVQMQIIQIDTAGDCDGGGNNNNVLLGSEDNFPLLRYEINDENESQSQSRIIHEQIQTQNHIIQSEPEPCNTYTDNSKQQHRFEIHIMLNLPSCYQQTRPELITTHLLGKNANSSSASVKNRNKKCHAAHDLRNALGVILNHNHHGGIGRRGGGVIADVSRDPGGILEGTIVRARQVYSLVDNRNISGANFDFDLDLADGAVTSEDSNEKTIDEDDDASSGNNSMVITGLRPKLRPYQAMAVRWMVQREKKQKLKSHTLCNTNRADPKTSSVSSSSNVDVWKACWVALLSSVPQANNRKSNGNGSIVLAQSVSVMVEESSSSGPLSSNHHHNSDQNCCYYNPFTGWLCRTLQEAKEATVGADENANVYGGILAESMGLGKTVEVLACILANPRFIDISSGGGGVNDTVVDNRDGTRDVSDLEMVVAASDGIDMDSKSSSHQQERQHIPAKQTTPANSTYTTSIEASAEAAAPNVIPAEEVPLPLRTLVKIKGNATRGFNIEEGVGRITKIHNHNNSKPQPSALNNNNAEQEQEHGQYSSHRYRYTVKYMIGGRTLRDVTRDRIALMDNNSESSSSSYTKDDDDMPCTICNRDIAAPSNYESNYWVRCSSCKERMHASCALYRTEAEVRALLPSLLCPAERCPCCAVNVYADKPIPSRATLIITPPAILDQWSREIQRHTTEATLRKVLIYPGIKKLCDNTLSNGKVDRSLVHPTTLADADIVLTTFPAIMTDLSHSGENPFVAAASSSTARTTNFRKRKRYRVIPSPLISIDWWRVCLDEAQKVETPTASSAKMALQLKAQNKWCVTGTPVSRGKLDDLYGLLLFLNVAPFSDVHSFRHCLHSNHDGFAHRLRYILRDIFWRSTKANTDVRKQMGVPEQEERMVLLQFSSIERHFYRQQLEHTILAANSVGNRTHNKKTAKTTKKQLKEVEMLSSRLHSLRAACCHPQVGSSGISRIAGSSSNAVANRVLTMDQILDKLIDDAKTKCEESQRLSVMHTNALASLHKLKVEARERQRLNSSVASRRIEDANSDDDDLLVQSAEYYLEALNLTDDNAAPSEVIGEAELSGCQGFRSQRRVVRNGKAILDWQWTTTTSRQGLDGDGNRSNNDDGTKSCCSLDRRSVWARFDFDVGKKLTAIRVRACRALPYDYPHASDHCEVLQPKDCVLQVSSASVGGEFVDVCKFQLTFCTDDDMSEDGSGDGDGKKDDPDSDYSWLSCQGFRTNKSKSWRILVQNYHPHKKKAALTSNIIKTMEWTTSSSATKYVYVGLEVHLMEPYIGADDLPRLHILYNASMVLSSIVQQGHRNTSTNNDIVASDDVIIAAEDHNSLEQNRRTKISNMKQRFDELKTESKMLESNYLGAARATHRVSQLHLQEAQKARGLCKDKLDALSDDNSEDDEDDSWWRDLLSWLHLNLSERDSPMDDHSHRSFSNLCQSLCQIVRNDLFELFDGPHDVGRSAFPTFINVAGLAAGLGMRRSGDENENGTANNNACLQRICALQSTPTDGEILENSHCHKCRADWFQTGPKCRHCKLEESLLEYEGALNDRVFLCILRAIAKWLVKWLKDFKPQTPSSTSVRGMPMFRRQDLMEVVDFLTMTEEKATVYFELQEAARKVCTSAKRAWRTHFDLLSDYDELNACKSAMRLLRSDEDVRELSEQHQSNSSVVVPRDIPALIMDHSAKQAMAMAVLRRNKDSLRYLRNQLVERRQDKEREERNSNTNTSSTTSNGISVSNGGGTSPNNLNCPQIQKSASSNASVAEEKKGLDKDIPTCAVCLAGFGISDRAVLACGHSFHYTPCLEKIIRRSGGNSNTMIKCPMRCTVRTNPKDVLIAGDDALVLRKDDGSRISRKIEGSWGTKVDRLLVDVMDVIELGEKCILFSQWDDLLTIVESALTANNICFTHPKSPNMFGESVKALRRTTTVTGVTSSSCSVMLLNVKRGAEGLTIVEATHVFMIEPLLHCGLDAQAINRIHRIGQTSKTYVHRYVVKDTIEVKIDEIRKERQATDGDENENEADGGNLEVRLYDYKGKIQAGGIDGGFTEDELQDILTVL